MLEQPSSVYKGLLSRTVGGLVLKDTAACCPKYQLLACCERVSLFRNKSGIKSKVLVNGFIGEMQH
jgi:hypothetical protein